MRRAAFVALGIAAAAATPAEGQSQIEWRGRATQGGLLIGTTEPGSEVTCDAPMPMCGAGLTPIVEDGCWGPCLQSVICRPMMCTAATVAADCPMDWECVGDMCRPPRTRP